MNGSLSRRRISRKILPARVLAVSGLGLLALLASSLFSSAPTAAQVQPVTPQNRLLHDWLYSHGGSRHVQYDIQTGELLLVGEAAHGLDYFSGGGGFWYCSFGGHSASPILSFLMRESTVENHDQLNHYPPGLTLPYTNEGVYSLIRLQPLVSQSTSVNEANEGTAYPDNYTEIPNWNLEFFLYQQVDGSFNIAVMDAGIGQEIEIGEALGDGSSNKDNGVRIDIAFRAQLPLPTEKLRWTQVLRAHSEAYETEHPTGF